MQDFYKNWAMKPLGLDKSFIPIHINVWYEYCKNAARNGSATVPSSEVREEEIFKDTRGTVISIQLNRKAYFRLYTATVTTKTDSTSLPPDQQVKTRKKKKSCSKIQKRNARRSKGILLKMLEALQEYHKEYLYPVPILIFIMQYISMKEQHNPYYDLVPRSRFGGSRTKNRGRGRGRERRTRDLAKYDLAHASTAHALNLTCSSCVQYRH